MFHLAISAPKEGRPRIVPMAGESLVVGRAEQCDVTVDDPFLSRQHARFFLEGDELRVEDLGSSNGTLVNGERIDEPCPVGPDDTILLSQTAIAIRTISEPVDTVDEPLPQSTMLRPIDELLPERPSEVEERGPEGETALRRYSERLRMLNDLHQALGRSIELDDLLELVLDGAFEHLEPTEGKILLQDVDGTLRVAASRVTDPDDERPVSKTLIKEVVEKGQGALVDDTHQDERFAGARSMLISKPRSLVAAPLMDSEGCLGMISVSAPLLKRPFEEEDLSLLASLASVAAMRIRNASLAEAARERERLETELEIARSVQVSLLPKELPEIEGWEIHASNLPSRGVSGDYYQLLTRNGGAECVFTVADVCGKGMGAALLTATVEAVSSALAEAGQSLSEVSAKTNRFVHRRTTPDKYATAFIGAIGPTGTVAYVNAGHVTPLVLRGDGSVDRIEPTGFPIGLVPDVDYEEGVLELEPGDLLVLYTDGIVEAENPEREEFEIERLLAVLERERLSSLQAIDEAVDSVLTEFTQGAPSSDDRTMLLLRRTGS